MNEEMKQQPLMFTVSEYKEIGSINSLITIGKNLERVDFNEIMNLIKAGRSDVDVMHEYILDFYYTIVSTNNFDKMSIEYMRNTIKFMSKYKDKFMERVVNPTEFNKYIQRPIQNVDRFTKIVDMCQILYNAIRFFVYNESDIHTVSLMTIMNMIGELSINDERLNYDLLKIIGRYNESKSSDVDEWLDTLEYDYEVFHQKNILDSVTDLMSVSPSIVLDLAIYRLIISSEIEAYCNMDELLEANNMEEALDELDLAVEYVFQTAIRNLDTIVAIMNNTKYAVSEYYIDIFNEELALLSYYKVEPINVELETETGDPDDKEVVKFESLRYKSSYNEDDLKDHIKARMYEYLVIGRYILEH